MSDDQFKALCNTYGFAPFRALREMIDCVRAQEIEACAVAGAAAAMAGQDYTGVATAIRARKENT